MSISLVWAQSADRYIGVDGTMPWHLPEDQAHFRALTDGFPVIMGRTTWESLPDRFRPLPGRQNIVLSRRTDLVLDGADVVGDPGAALAVAGGRDVWVIGGTQVYEAFLPIADRLELTQVDVVVGGDTKAPVLDGGWHLVGRRPEQGWSTSATGLRYRFLSFRRATDGAGTSRRDDGAGR